MRGLANLARLAIIVALVAGGTGLPARAQLDPAVRARVLPAVVQVAVTVVATENGASEETLVPRGSGTVVSADGLVLTNYHVIDLGDLEARLALDEADFKRQGRDRTLRAVPDSFVLLFSERDEPPVRRFTARVATDASGADQASPVVDLAVLHITGGSRGQALDTATIDLPFVDLGDSDTVQIGDRVHILGYPSIGVGALTYTEGAVSGFGFEDGIQGRAWISSDATLSGGSSGGAAVDDAGRLIGVPTLAGSPECRPGDTNGDGAVDERDVGCVPIGGALNRLRPIHLAKPLLQAAGLPEETATATPVPTETLSATSEPTAAPTPTPVPTVLTGHTDEVISVAFSPDGSTLASGSRDATVILWNVATGQQIGEPLVGHVGEVRAVAFSPDGRTLASGSLDGTVILWDPGARKQIGAPLVGHTSFVLAVAFSPDGSTLASGSDDDTVILWHPDARKQIGEPLAGHTDQVRGVAFSPDGRTLASGSLDGTVILWDPGARKQIGAPLVGHTSFVLAVAFSPDGSTLASGNDDGTVILWDVATGQQIGEPFAGHTDQVRGVAFSPDGRTLASGSLDGTVILWDVATGQQIGEPFAGHTDQVRGVAFSPDGRTLASGSSDGTVILWEVASRQPLAASPLGAHV